MLCCTPNNLRIIQITIKNCTVAIPQIWGEYLKGLTIPNIRANLFITLSTWSSNDVFEANTTPRDLKLPTNCKSREFNVIIEWEGTGFFRVKYNCSYFCFTYTHVLGIRSFGSASFVRLTEFFGFVVFIGFTYWFCSYYLSFNKKPC